MSSNAPRLVVRDTDKSRDGVIVNIFDVVRGTLNTDTVLDEIEGASISYQGEGKTDNQQPYTRYILTTNGDTVRCVVVLDVIMAILKGDTTRHRRLVNEAAQLLP